MVPNDLKWYKRDGLDTWYLQDKCNEFINITDTYFKRMKITNIDMIKNIVPKEKLKQYQTLDMMKINSIHLSFVSKFAPQYFEMLIEKICMCKNKQL